MPSGNTFCNPLGECFDPEFSSSAGFGNDRRKTVPDYINPVSNRNYSLRARSLSKRRVRRIRPLPSVCTSYVSEDDWLYDIKNLSSVVEVVMACRFAGIVPDDIVADWEKNRLRRRLHGLVA